MREREIFARYMQQSGEKHVTEVTYDEMREPTCTFVTERAEEGPCVGDVKWPLIPAMRCLGEPEQHCADSTCTIDHDHHAYLGPVLARCGHEEGEHWAWGEWLHSVAEGIFLYAEWHEFTSGD